MRLRSQLRIPGYLVRRRVEGRDLLKAAAAFGNAQLTSREKITAEAPVMLVTTADLANQLAKALGPKAGTYALQLKDGHLIPLPSTSSQLPTSLRDVGVTLIEGQIALGPTGSLHLGTTSCDVIGATKASLCLPLSNRSTQPEYSGSEPSSSRGTTCAGRSSGEQPNPVERR